LRARPSRTRINKTPLVGARAVSQIRDNLWAIKSYYFGELAGCPHFFKIHQIELPRITKPPDQILVIVPREYLKSSKFNIKIRNYFVLVHDDNTR
jgi:hypothetical protein